VRRAGRGVEDSRRRTPARRGGPDEDGERLQEGSGEWGLSSEGVKVSAGQSERRLERGLLCSELCRVSLCSAASHKRWRTPDPASSPTSHTPSPTHRHPPLHPHQPRLLSPHSPPRSGRFIHGIPVEQWLWLSPSPRPLRRCSSIRLLTSPMSVLLRRAARLAPPARVASITRWVPAMGPVLASRSTPQVRLSVGWNHSPRSLRPWQSLTCISSLRGVLC
jgi:hypothetical protein